MSNDVLKGTVAGLVATGPMTAVMKLGFLLLPIHQKYPLPPRQITGRVGKVLGIWQAFEEDQKKALTLAAHYGYGGAAGALYCLLFGPQHRNVLTGTGYGMVVWAGSYLGLLPSLNIMQPATRQPAQRNVLMIVAHLVWGATVAGVMRLFDGHSLEATVHERRPPSGPDSRPRERSSEPASA